MITDQNTKTVFLENTQVFLDRTEQSQVFGT